MSEERGGVVVRLCATCDGCGYLHDDLPVGMTDVPHRAALPGIEPCEDCTRCPECGRDGCGPGVIWDDDALVDMTSARELDDLREEAGALRMALRDLWRAVPSDAIGAGGALELASAMASAAELLGVTK